MNEISGADLSENGEEEIENEYSRASNSAQLTEIAASVNQMIDGEDESILTHLGAVGRQLLDLTHLDPHTTEFVSAHEQIVEMLNELQAGVSNYLDRIDVDPRRLNELETRMNQIQSLKRKYGKTVSDVIAFGNAAAEKLQSMEARDGELEEINSRLAKLDEELWNIGSDLSKKRAKVIPKLCKVVEKELSDLGFKQSRFGIELTSQAKGDRKRTSSGIDRIEFQFSPNPGEPLKALRSIASSGEMARVMLALKTVLAAEDKIPVLVFDEVDANVGGETAAVVGEKMKQIGANRQVFCITHLAPVAAAAQNHFVVSKAVKDNRTLTEVKQLNKKDRVTELARMLGGQGPAQKKHAEALLR